MPDVSPLAAKAWWGPDGLHFAPGLNSRIVREYLSPSSASSYKSCPARFAIEKVIRRPEDPFGAAELGTAAHAALEELMGLEPKLRTQEMAEEVIVKHLPVAAERVSAVVEVFARAHRLGARARVRETALRVAGQIELNFIQRPDLLARVEQVVAQLDGHRLKRGTVARLAGRLDGANEICLPAADEIGRWVGEVRSRVQGLWQIEDPTAAEVWYRELKIEQVVDGVPVLGYVDRVDRGASGIPVVVDYKTGKPPSRKDAHGDQLRIYCLAVANKTGLLPHRALAYYTAHGVAHEVNVSRQALNKTVAGFRQTWSDMQASSAAAAWPARPSALCGWCPLALVCPAARAAGRAVARSEIARIGPELGIGYGDEAGAVEAVPTGAGAAHTREVAQSIETGTATAHKEAAMSTTTGTKFGAPEGKRWEQMVPGTADLNPASDTVTALFGLVELSVETLEGASQKLTTTNVDALAQTFARLVADAYSALALRPSFQDWLHVRLRGALRTALEHFPVPFGQDEEAWEKWYQTVLRRTVSIARAALRLWDAELPAKPWAPLVVAGAPEEQKPQLQVVRG